MSIFNFIKNHKKLLILRKTGGLGDIMMHRMLFEDIKKKYINYKLYFSCPERYIEAVKDHPFLDGVISSESLNLSDFNFISDTTEICGIKEMEAAPFPYKHRSDIWAEHIGIKLENHNMHLLNNYEKKIDVCFCPLSAISSKSLDKNQINQICDYLTKNKISYYGLSEKNIDGFYGELYKNLTIEELFKKIGEARLLLTVDSAPFHIGGGLGINMIGIFSWCCGKTYGKYYNNWKLVQKHRDDGWDCGPCYNWSACKKVPFKQIKKPCITDINIEEVFYHIKNENLQRSADNYN